MLPTLLSVACAVRRLCVSAWRTPPNTQAHRGGADGADRATEQWLSFYRTACSYDPRNHCGSGNNARSSSAETNPVCPSVRTRVPSRFIAFCVDAPMNRQNSPHLSVGLSIDDRPTDHPPVEHPSQLWLLLVALQTAPSPSRQRTSEAKGDEHNSPPARILIRQFFRTQHTWETKSCVT